MCLDRFYRGLDGVGAFRMAIKSFSEFISSIEKFRGTAANSELWYRGHGANSYVLQPGLHRSSLPLVKDMVITRENTTYDEFYRRSPLFDRPGGRDRWDLLFLMQHYRAPTRLLDWTSSPLVALFFALLSGHDTEDAVLWCLDPAEWNGKMLHDIGEAPKIFPTDDSMILQYHPKFDGKASRNEPLAIQGIVNNPRINAQKGKFVIFGTEPRSMEDFAKEFKIKPNGEILRKIEIDSSRRKAVMNDLESYGITYSTVFPDLEGLAIEISRKLMG
ncbi:FRG domain-containing protein [Mesorhizobium sp. M2D.F.Ca.ET.185.01.1.1]|uniref:FRG domain-containing protein n=2 Tax=unclassified Mesorhizobium TaxID=325217 RepID=UPI000FCAD7F2|nr:FRG domain-containing protein [Mesorhizobium sp. M2D.F.Ca.ET.140.01.1.1]TGP14244.1 FRG domain-containing protein [Mesorhizobium sp. M2D.F.Ca.ET.233.01.1.1]TGP30045.1 FRG domain-containing protein [Mesorhizobium sp. M2D.F.Ca.ET.232.01.1.1]TGP54790.1 FRG domain-containing protein [Mesorhizobium sp. M2D.F.Ca.ET.226.01.1.1]TGP63724.1 FRG domain-containing protein [Mesorhizobium sp. M2D.F.Ca.ET.225.01.1.1]TGP73184.1 FRG domain-containing protein [Mesorhizobium sp. M2D.F.Ca.ET.224.01.1.1]TGP7394